ncbi:MAG TPA: MFS transporter [Firmicutes bacterium]|nr:MFS transporter [Bacillota bacterium]
MAFISLGLPDSLLGSGWPAIHLELNIDNSYMGFVSMVISFGTIISSLLSSKLISRIGTRFVTLGSVFLTVIALFGFSFSKEFWMLIVFAIPYGLGAGAVDSALNSYVAVHYKAKHMSWLHCFWGAGTIISPFIMGYALTSSSWQDGYRIVGFIQLGIALLLFVTLPVWKVNKSEEEKQTKQVSTFSCLKIKGVIFVLIGFFAYCALEATAMQWASTYFVEVKGVDKERSAMLASLFYIGITFGRFISGFFIDKIGDKKAIIIGCSFLFLGIILLSLPINCFPLAISSFIILGFGCGPIYPCFIHSTPTNFGNENSSSIVGLEMTSAYIGTTFMSPLFGLLGNRFGFKIMPIYLIFFALLMTGMMLLSFKGSKNKINTANN